MISEDWSNDAENTDLITEIHYSFTEIHIENMYFNISQHYSFSEMQTGKGGMLYMGLF